MAEREYKCLARGRARSGFAVVAVSRCSLWLGKDHLLSIETNGYTENYKRFYFKDIQGVIVCKTQHWKIWGLVIGIPAGVFALVAVFAGNPVASWIFGVVAGLLALGLIVDLAGGPTCKCHLRTAVQVEELPALNRLRRARKALQRLRPIVAAAQGQLPAEEIPARLQAWRAANAGTTAAATEPPGGGAADPGAPSPTVTDA